MKIVSASPHLHGGDSTKRIMRDVVIALLPAFGFSIVMYGLSAIAVTLLAVVSCMFFEWAIAKFLDRKSVV